MLSTLLGVSLLVVLVVNECNTESSLVALGPLEVVQKRPSKVTVDIHAVECGGIGHGSHIVVVVLGTEIILQNLLTWHIVLALDTGTILGNVQSGVTIALGNPDKQITEAWGTWPQPGRLGLGADTVASVVPEVVVVHAIEIIGSEDKSLLLRGESRETVAKLSLHRGRVITKVDGISKPRDGKFDFSFGSLNIFRVLRVPGICGVAIEGDSDLTTILGLEFLAAQLKSHRHQTCCGQSSGRERWNRCCNQEWLSTRARSLEIKRELFAVHEATIAAVQLVGDIPVEKGDKGGNAGVKKVVNKLAVVVNSSLVDRVFATTERNDSGPAERETVRLGA
ncbi:hypothetical protein HG530_003283 [Fusarium avenaceum]|nr:hypothetical protein HG530_003283 [Fusarium avenaceum]